LYCGGGGGSGGEKGRKEGRKDGEGKRRRDDRTYTYNVDPSSTVSGGGGRVAKNGWKVVGVRRLLRRTGEITLANRRRPHFVGKHFA